MTVPRARGGAILNSYTKADLDCRRFATFDFSSLASTPSLDKALLRLWVSEIIAPGTVDVAVIPKRDFAEWFRATTGS